MSAIQPSQSSLIQSRYKHIDEKDWENVCGRDGSQTNEGKAVTEFINSNTTPREFDAFCKKYPNYEPEHGGERGRTALGKAIFIKNIPLVQHIICKQVIELGKTHLLNGDVYPHLCETVWSSQFELSKLLIMSGANVNLADTCCSSSSFPYFLVTPLLLAAQKARLSMVNMFIVRGGLTYTPFSELEQQIVKKALDLLFNRVKPLFIAKQDAEGTDDGARKDMFYEIILRQIWVEAHTYLEEKPTPPIG